MSIRVLCLLWVVNCGGKIALMAVGCRSCYQNKRRCYCVRSCRGEGAEGGAQVMRTPRWPFWEAEGMSVLTWAWAGARGSGSRCGRRAVTTSRRQPASGSGSGASLGNCSRSEHGRRAGGGARRGERGQTDPRRLVPGREKWPWLHLTSQKSPKRFLTCLGRF